MHLHLSETVQSADLRRLGWLDFRSLDHAERTDPVQLAEDALFYLCVDDVGRWNRHLDVLAGLIVFLAEATDARRDAGALQAFRELLERPPVSREAVSAWFDHVYPLA